MKGIQKIESISIIADTSIISFVIGVMLTFARREGLFLETFFYKESILKLVLKSSDGKENQLL